MENETNEPQVGREMTFGEKAVGLTFNPSGDEKVEIMKKSYACVIDNLDSMKTEAQAAQMWAVKALTWKD